MQEHEASVGDDFDFPSEIITRKTGTSTKSGYLIVISAPSGGGKTSVIRRLLANHAPDYMYSISATTRPPRHGEQHGCDYHFISTEEFMARANAGGFVEWAKVHGNLYGTPKEPVERWLQAGKLVFMDLDVQGGINVKKQYGDRAILIFIEPPSLESLQQRLLDRNTDSAETIKSRLEAAKAELRMARYYDHVVVNHNLEDTVAQVRAIIDRYRQ